MPRPNVTLPDQLAEPMFCKEPDDFALMVLQIIKSTYAAARGDRDEFLSFLTLSVKIICHEYMACVLSKTFDPYLFDQEFRDNEYEDFRKVILEAKAEAMKAGLPMVEKDGKFIFDAKEIAKRARLEEEDDRET